MNTDKKSLCPQSLSRISQRKSESPRERRCKRVAYIIKDIDELCTQVPSQGYVKFNDIET